MTKGTHLTNCLQSAHLLLHPLPNCVCQPSLLQPVALTLLMCSFCLWPMQCNSDSHRTYPLCLCSCEMGVDFLAGYHHYWCHSVFGIDIAIVNAVRTGVKEYLSKNTNISILYGWEIWMSLTAVQQLSHTWWFCAIAVDVWHGIFRNVIIRKSKLVVFLCGKDTDINSNSQCL